MQVRYRDDASPWRRLAMVASVVLAGCAVANGNDAGSRSAEVPELHAGMLAGYLPAAGRPDSLKLLPPPPAPDSAAQAADADIARQQMPLRGTARWQLAVADAELRFPQAAGAFSCALGAPITEQDTPHLVLLLRRSLADAGLSTAGAKNHYQRARPFMVNGQPMCTPADADRLRKSGSYPSGHNAAGWAWALILAELAPDRADALLARGLAFGQSRVVCNVHWQSDANAGRLMGAAAVARLHADPAFVADMAAAREEIAAVRARGLAPTRDCAAEAAALAP